MATEATLKIVDGEANPNGASKTKPRVTKPKATKERERPQRVLPTTRLTLSKHFDILRGYYAASGASGKAVTVEEVAAIVGVAASSFSLVNPFFCDVQLLQRLEQKGQPSRYVPSQEVVNFAKAYEWNRETAAQKMAPALSRAWFSEILMRNLTFNPLEEEQAITLLAEAASAGPDYKDELRVIIDYLEAAGVIQRDNGVIRAMRSNNAAQSAPERENEPSSQKDATAPVVKSSTIATSFLQPSQGGVSFNIDVRINMDEFAHWTPDRISSFFAGIAQVLAAKGAMEKEAGKT